MATGFVLNEFYDEFLAKDEKNKKMKKIKR